MTTSPTSYLQTLDKKEAIAFIASLQKVKEHLTHELQWINAQAEQKTTQLQGIEAILVEAVTLGLISTSPTDSTSSDDSLTNSSVEMPLSSSNGSAALFDINTTSADVEDAEDEDELPAITDSKSDRPKAANSKPKSVAQSTAQKSRGSKAKSTGATKKSTSKASLLAKSPDLKHFVKAEFQEQSFTDAVSQILEESSKPIGLSDVIAKLYGDLSNQDYQRAKISLTNVLSTGKNKGKWKSIGRGMYASNATAAAL
ncbi:hypothetical protein JOY44_06450 [Phormidium sp. CLA17]|uniref:hypothetical protein n=1 Tax=Leptolyngbya sp. Cla-17 TaxID=2803751 RepID=UPI0014925647|nr:hypothetical protein [Leptolyngbya sp. Cla-17]MBM0741261.1 hypothetical protein [Leptolyngbya sp. Cla-17]